MSKIRVSLSKGKKTKSARQEFLSALMKNISGDAGDGLTQAFKKKRASEFGKLFDAVKEKMMSGMKGSNKATAAASISYIDVVSAFNRATGSEFPPSVYEGWLEGDADDSDTVLRFEATVKEFMGSKLFAASTKAARVDAVLQQLLFPKKKIYGGGVDLMKLITDNKGA